MLNELSMQIAVQCAPLLENIKMSNLIMVKNEEAEWVHQIFKDEDISVRSMGKTHDRISFFLYREEKLQEYLNRTDIFQYMRELGYNEPGAEMIIQECATRYSRYLLVGGEFPHEIGILLGYPIDDVRDFIANKGENSLYTGYWKVYNDLDQAKKIFTNYSNSVSYVLKCLQDGKEIKEIIRRD